MIDWWVVLLGMAVWLAGVWTGYQWNRADSKRAVEMERASKDFWMAQASALTRENHRLREENAALFDEVAR